MSLDNVTRNVTVKEEKVDPNAAVGRQDVQWMNIYLSNGDTRNRQIKQQEDENSADDTTKTELKTGE